MIQIQGGLDCSRIVRGAELLPKGPGVWPPKPWTEYPSLNRSINNNRRTVTVLVDGLQVTLELFGADTVPHLHCIFPAPQPYVEKSLPEPRPALAGTSALACLVALGWSEDDIEIETAW